MRAWMWLALSLGLLSSMPILAMELSFTEAQELLMEVSDAIAGSQNQLEGSQHLAQASKSLSYPEVTLDVKQMRFAKRSEEHTSELQSRPHLVCRLLLEK